MCRITYMRSWKSHRLTSHTWLGLNPQIGRPLSRIVVPLVYFFYFFEDVLVKNSSSSIKYLMEIKNERILTTSVIYVCMCFLIRASFPILSFVNEIKYPGTLLSNKKMCIFSSNLMVRIMCHKAPT
jgi:hypothetical protein